MCIDIFGDFYYPILKNDPRYIGYTGEALLFRWDYFGIYIKVSPFHTNNKLLVTIG